MTLLLRSNLFVVRAIRFVAFQILSIIVHLAFLVRWITIVECHYRLEDLFDFFYTSKERLPVRFRKLCSSSSLCPTFANSRLLRMYFLLNYLGCESIGSNKDINTLY